jgi:hypothetical protein
VSLTVLGLSGSLSHDPSAALYIDGKLVAAAEEERFVRDKHAKNRMPYEAAKFCLDFAGIKPSDVDAVAIPFAPISLIRAGALALREALLVRAGPRARRDPQRQPPLPPLPQAASSVPGKQLGFDRRRSRSCRSSTTCPRLQRLPLLGLHGEDRDPRHRRQGRVRDHLLRLRRERQASTRSRSSTTPIRSAASTAPSPSTSASRCSTASTRSWAWRPTATRTSTISRAWRSSRTASSSSTPTTPT